MSDNKIHELLLKVVKASEEKKIDWEKNPKTSNSFKAILGNNTLHIIEIDSFQKTFIIQSEFGDQIGNYSEMLSLELDRLYDLAKAKALKIDENLKDINNILDSL